MRIDAIGLGNCGPFKGSHMVELPTHCDVFAVTARRERDEESSNWVGKSYLMKTIPLALFDEYPSELADGWISDGEGEGSAGLALSSNAVIATRTRKRGASTQFNLEVTGVDGRVSTATQKHAQTRLEEVLGLDKDLFFATSFIRQKKVNAFVTASPEVRLGIVAEWLGLDRLRKAKKRAADEFTQKRREAERLRVEEPKDLLERAKELLGKDLGGEPTPIDAIFDELNAVRVEVEGELESAKKEIEATKKAAEEEKIRDVELLRLQGQAREFDEIAKRGKALQAELAEIGVGKTPEDDLEVARAANDEARSNVRLRREAFRSAQEVARGEFDGKCPVNGRDCPVVAEINRDDEKARQTCRAADKALRKAEEAEGTLGKQYEDIRQAVELRKEIRALSDRAKPLRGSRKAAEKLEAEASEGTDARARLEAAYEARGSAQVKLDRIDRFYRDWKAFEERNAGVAEKAEAAKKALAVAADKVEVFARAEREIGRATLLEIEELANRLLGKAGVDLSIRMSWGRETGTLEPTCHRCGWQYPRGQATKECADCGAERMPKIDERLDLVPSARSDGAAEDLAGLAVSLAAAAWLRAERNIRLGIIVLDEVTASFDRANRRALGSVLAQMIREAGFEQGFVISHSPDVVESLPGKITIVEAKDGSRRIEVAA